MTLTSFTFFAFFAFSLIVYYLFPLKYRWTVLLFFSFVFFMLSSTPHTLIYLVANVLSIRMCACGITKAKKQEKIKLARTLLILGIVINVGMLAVLKYNRFAIQNG